MLLSSLPIHEIAALAAATCWSFTGLISAVPAGHLGALSFNRTRQLFVTAVLALYVLGTGTWHGLAWDHVLPLLLSGIVGIFLGDTLLFAALNRVGPRRAGILFALNAPMTAALGWVWLGERLSLEAVSGVLLTVAGVGMAIRFGTRKSDVDRLEDVKGPLWIGVALGLGAALGQAAGSIIARPVMASGIDPFAASMLRVGIAALFLTALMQLPLQSVKAKGTLTWRIAGLTALTGILALGIGMTLLLFALSGGKAGIITTLSATSPVLILPLLWLKTGRRPAPGAWAGAGLVVIGMALLFAGRG